MLWTEECNTESKNKIQRRQGAENMKSITVQHILNTHSSSKIIAILLIYPFYQLVANHLAFGAKYFLSVQVSPSKTWGITGMPTATWNLLCSISLFFCDIMEKCLDLRVSTVMSVKMMVLQLLASFLSSLRRGHCQTEIKYINLAACWHSG